MVNVNAGTTAVQRPQPEPTGQADGDPTRPDITLERITGPGAPRDNAAPTQLGENPSIAPSANPPEAKAPESARRPQRSEEDRFPLESLGDYFNR